MIRIFGFTIFNWRKAVRAKWMRIPLIIIGLLCLFGAIWFGFPAIGILLLATIWLRAAVIGTILAIILIVVLIKWRRRRRAARSLEDSLMQPAPGDEAVLSEKMQEALAKLKKAGGKTYLYDLPWYIIIGPPGAGKTTALRNSQIEFPGTKMDAVEGFGGTKACDWWFAEDAVLIDTAGRYVTQDSDSEADSASWTAFLDLLKRGRPNQPINGVVLAFSVEDILNPPPGHIEAQAEIVRARLAEIHQTLKIDFPVYVMFTKADMIAGFREYFSSLSQSRRRLVWGATFQTKDRKAETYTQVVGEFDALLQRLSDEIIDRMSEEPDSVSRISIFGLPGQMALMRSGIEEFLRRVFEPSRYKTNALLRGFYFSSGTQEGTPIDQVLGAISRNSEEEAEAGGFRPAFMSGKGRSYFLHDLLKKVIFAERDWVSFDARAVRRTKILRGIAISLILICTFGALGAFGYSYWQNATLLRQADAGAAAYFRIAQSELNRAVIDDPDPTPVLEDLQLMRLVTAGYGDPREPEIWEGFGLGQYKRTHVATSRAYSDALERLLRPRLILYLENELPQLEVEGNTAAVYRALKVYILLGRQQEGAPDDAAVQGYFSDVWREEFSGIGQQDDRDALEEHLAAMLDLDDDRTASMGIDAEIVRSAREQIVNLPLFEQAYASIKDRAALSGVPDFNLVNRLGGQVADVLQTRDQTDINALIVPGMFTFEGYWGFFLDEMANARERLVDDRWVLGEEADRVDYDRQLSTLEDDLHRLYQEDFKRAWSALLDNLALKPMANDPPNYNALAAAASPTASPILQLVEAVQEETRLTRLYEQIDSLDPADVASGNLGGNLGGAMMQRIYGRSGALQRVVLTYLRDSAKVQERAGNALAEDTQRRQVERITEQFEDWHILLTGTPGQRPIDAIMINLGAVRDNRRQAARAPTPVDEQMLQSALSALTANNTALPETLGRLLNGAESEFRSVAQDATLTEINRALNDNVTQFCNEFIAPLFPFGSGRHVSPSVFGQFFGPSGRMDSFFQTYLAAHVSRTSDGFVPAADSAIADRLSPQLLTAFEQAEQIKIAFFASGSPEPEVGMSVTHVSSSPSVELAILTINGSTVRTQPGGSAVSLVWPGDASGVTLELFPQNEGRNSTLSFTGGRWSIVDLLRQGSARISGNVVDLTLQVGGRTITYKMEFDSTTTPFLMRELSDFTCPTGIE